MKMNIMQRIETMRSELVQKGEKYGFQDPQVLAISKKLDRLINAYYQLEAEGFEVEATG